MSEMDVEAGISVGLGITVDPDDDVVILVVVANEDVRLGVPLMPNEARNFAAAMVNMSYECDRLRQELMDLSPEEIQQRLRLIQDRFAAGTN